MTNIKEWASLLLESKTRTTIPIMTNPGIELCNYHVIDAVTNGIKHYEAIKKLCDLFPSAAATVIMDLTVEAEAFGAEVAFQKDEIPSVIGTIVKDLADVENLTIPSLSQGRLQEYLLANRLVADNILDRPAFAGCIGPFSLAGRLMGMSELMTGIYIDPEMVSLLLEKCTSFLLKYCRAIKDTGIEGVMIAEPAAGLISAQECSMYSSVYIKRIVEELQDDSFIIVLHNCGNTGHCTSSMIESGAFGFHFGNRINMLDALKECPKESLVMGNIDPVGCLKLSTPQDVYISVTKLLKQTSGFKNFILSTGCDVPPQIDVRNIEAYYQALFDFNTKLM